MLQDDIGSYITLESNNFLRMHFNDFDTHSDIWPNTGCQWMAVKRSKSKPNEFGSDL